MLRAWPPQDPDMPPASPPPQTEVRLPPTAMEAFPSLTAYGHLTPLSAAVLTAPAGARRAHVPGWPLGLPLTRRPGGLGRRWEPRPAGRAGPVGGAHGGVHAGREAADGDGAGAGSLVPGSWARIAAQEQPRRRESRPTEAHEHPARGRRHPGAPLRGVHRVRPGPQEGRARRCCRQVEAADAAVWAIPLPLPKHLRGRDSRHERGCHPPHELGLDGQGYARRPGARGAVGDFPPGLHAGRPPAGGGLPWKRRCSSISGRNQLQPGRDAAKGQHPGERSARQSGGQRGV
mmetsp:Transcript_44123/g.110775  ORF Transcript_44123/g.110775 Transcript_44123/m.110775 type:complete len:289 (-) Transcript_44123:991-1857(-)